MTEIKGIEILRKGTFTSSEGVEVSFSNADLQRIASEYNSRIEKTAVLRPVTDGHPQPGSNVPAYGWVTSLRAADGVLFADIEASEQLAQWFKNKEKRYRSIGLRNGMFDHLAVLGSDAPAVDKLGDVEFSKEDESTINFSIHFPIDSEDTMSKEQEEPKESPELLQFRAKSAELSAENEQLKQQLKSLNFSLSVEKYTQRLTNTALPAARVEEVAKALATLGDGTSNFSTDSPLGVIVEAIAAIPAIDKEVLTNNFAANGNGESDEAYIEKIIKINAEQFI